MRVHVLREEERLQGERLALGPDQAELLLAGLDEAAEGAHAPLLHRLEQEHVRPPRRRRARRDEEVGAVEEDRIDLVEPHEACDVDRARVALALDRLEIGVLDDHELALRDLPAADDLVRLDDTLVRRAEPLLLDRRAALPVEKPERDVGLPGGRLRGRRKPDRDRDQAKAEGAVPCRPHTGGPILGNAPFPFPDQ